MWMRIAVDRIVEILAGVVRQSENGARGLNWTAGALEAPESLAQRVKRRCLRNHAVEIEVHSDLETLRRDDEHWSGLLTAGRFGAGIEGPEALCNPIPIHPPRATDHQGGFGIGIRAQNSVDSTCQRYPIHHHPDGGCGQPGLLKGRQDLLGRVRESLGWLFSVADRSEADRLAGPDA